MPALLWIFLAVGVVLLDLAAFISAIVGLLTFFALERLQPYRWYMIGFGILGTIMLLPLADYFIGKAIRSVTSA